MVIKMSGDRDGVTVNFDHNSPNFAADAHRIYEDLRARCPVAFSPNHNGYWVISRYEEVTEVLRDWETFSSRHLSEPVDGLRYQGILIPPGDFVAGLAEYDPPEWHLMRRALTPLFSPVAVERLRPRIAEFTTALIDRHIEKGRIDLINDLAGPVPALTTMELTGLPLNNWEHFARVCHEMNYTPADHPRHAEVMGGVMEMMRQVREEIHAQHDTRKPGVISTLIDAEVDGQRLSDDQIESILLTVIAGGVDTTTSLAGWALLHLHRDHEARQRLIAEPGLLPRATEEFLRHASIAPHQSRTVTRDVEIGGQLLRRGDRVMVSMMSANRDPAEFNRPDEIVLDRMPNRHVAFGMGIHRCLGSNLARAEFTIMLNEVLRRMPDYTIDEDAVAQYPSLAVTNGYIQMPATFSPRHRLGHSTPI